MTKDMLGDFWMLLLLLLHTLWMVGYSLGRTPSPVHRSGRARGRRRAPVSCNSCNRITQYVHSPITVEIGLFLVLVSIAYAFDLEAGRQLLEAVADQEQKPEYSCQTSVKSLIQRKDKEALHWADVIPNSWRLAVNIACAGRATVKQPQP
jgi:hypothetical protein